MASAGGGALTGGPGATFTGPVTLGANFSITTDGTNTVYTGPINAVGTVQLPNTFLPSVFPWPAAAAHTYTFTVTFPDGGTPGTATTGDNAYKGSSMTMQFWPWVRKVWWLSRRESILGWQQP